MEKIELKLNENFNLLRSEPHTSKELNNHFVKNLKEYTFLTSKLNKEKNTFSNRSEV